MSRTQKAGNEAVAEQQKKTDPGYTPGQVQVKLHSSWSQYVKGLGGEKEKSGAAGDYQTGDKTTGDKAKPEGGYTTGDDSSKPKLSDNPDPKTVHDKQDYVPEYKKFEDPVFKGAPKHTDVNQGYLADCYLVAAMAAVAHQRPDLIEQMIEDHGDGSVTVTLYKSGGYWAAPGEGDAVKVRISTELPSKDGTRPAYARGADKQLWPALIEKAYVAIKLGGKYQAANTGGSAGEAMQAILGKPSGSWSTSSKGADKIAGAIDALLKAGKPLCAGSLGKDEYEKDSALGDLADSKRVVPWHAYVIVAVDPAAGTIELYNPWGTKHPEKLAGADFQKLYKWVYEGSPPAPKTAPAT